MIQVIPKESPHRSEYLDNSLAEIKMIAEYHEPGIIDYNDTFRIGNIALMRLIGYYPIWGLLDNELVKEDDPEEFIKIQKAKMRYYTGYIYENYSSEVKFSLYPCTPRIERYYLEQGYLPMKIGPFDWKTYNKYASLITNN